MSLRTIGTAVLLLLVFLCVRRFGSLEDHIKDLASRYDLVGIVTHTSVLKWNNNPDRSKSGRIYPVDREKVPGGALYIGLGEDLDPDTPYFGEIYIRGTFYGFHELFVRVHIVEGSQMEAMDDEGNEFLITIVRRGSGYKPR